MNPILQNQIKLDGYVLKKANWNLITDLHHDPNSREFDINIFFENTLRHESNGFIMDFNLNNNDQLNTKSTDLSLMAHGIRNIDEIPLHKNLLSINLHSNEIERISGLTGLNYLTHLDLSSNNITRIQGLEGLVSLDTLNLASNKIAIVEGLFALK